MIDLQLYREYWERMAGRLPGVTSALMVTLDDQMGRKIQQLPADSVTLMVLPPVAESAARDADNRRELNRCVVFVMAKYDPQRVPSWMVLESTQRVAEAVKTAMMADLSSGCPVMAFDPGSVDTAAETELYGRLAGWSIGFNVYSHD
jgi:hypothetical protein